jgi:hypothetical protein
MDTRLLKSFMISSSWYHCLASVLMVICFHTLVAIGTLYMYTRTLVSRASPSYTKREKGSGGKGRTAMSPWNAIDIFMYVN